MQCGPVIRSTGFISNQLMTSSIKISVMRGDDIGADVTDTALTVTASAKPLAAILSAVMLLDFCTTKAELTIY
ncbi:MAG: hypothetical protein CMM73_06115 [Rhodospirillaceae bacterium]|nr:hypothetical protein [Rhodospirillaceae bacterium]